ncbi:MAG: hypothetical protein BGO37_06870 [Cellulomonas sp. 73-92]|uniref:ParB N-terminal domain-containing protein n=1 Tax=Cellulomonas sp. 73-92 TaxID=1895740 RepID=UPI00092847D6|nr:ParB N-terminal domain-containing protein [Cellulomonas sp. 73-92]OJV75953.1 MAG: hypothetical protein BGO37_06870 [Cellulomonas sp. 73-92]
MSRDGHLVLEHAIDEIHVGHAYRHDLGDLSELANSIRRVGLLAPITITTGNVLIAGNRRLAALRQLGQRTTPVWVVTGVSDRLSTVLAIQDEHTLHKLLSPIEQAQLYGELKELLAEDAARRQQATRFGAPTPDPQPSGDGGVDSTPPSPTTTGGGKTRVQAARAVTGRDSHGMLDHVVELQQIAADDAQDPQVRQAAAEALLELNTDGKVNGRYLHVKLLQAVSTLTGQAQDPDQPDPVRAAAADALAQVQAQPTAKDALAEATRALTRITELGQDATASTTGRAGWTDADPLARPRHQIRKLVDLLRREHGWWDQYDPVEFARYADPDQWALVESYLAGATGFLDTARAARPPGPVAVAS